jgi:hypothetical protein
MVVPTPYRYQVHSVGIAGVGEFQSVQAQDLKQQRGLAVDAQAHPIAGRAGIQRGKETQQRFWWRKAAGIDKVFVHERCGGSGLATVKLEDRVRTGRASLMRIKEARK